VVVATILSPDGERRQPIAVEATYAHIDLGSSSHAMSGRRKAASYRKGVQAAEILIVTTPLIDHPSDAGYALWAKATLASLGAATGVSRAAMLN
jgi:hypothetical protein